MKELIGKMLEESLAYREYIAEFITQCLETPESDADLTIHEIEDLLENSESDAINCLLKLEDPSSIRRAFNIMDLTEREAESIITCIKNYKDLIQ